MAAEGASPGWTFVPASETPASEALAASAPFVFSFKGSPFRTYEAPPYANSTIFKNGDIDILNGDLDATGGKVTAKNPNGTYPTTTTTFGAPIVVRGDEYVTSVDATTGGTAFTDRSNFVVGIRISHCINLEWVLTSPHEAIWESGYNPTPTPPTPHPAPPGKFTIFSAVTGKKSAPSSTISAANNVVLWLSWPASSPWVTSVGATRFVGQKGGNEEMATDQFGSGGGFSKQFAQSPNAE
jgi:hypothetical protein